MTLLSARAPGYDVAGVVFPPQVIRETGATGASAASSASAAMQRVALST